VNQSTFSQVSEQYLLTIVQAKDQALVVRRKAYLGAPDFSSTF